jgi:hypothetical protein
VYGPDQCGAVAIGSTCIAAATDRAVSAVPRELAERAERGGVLLYLIVPPSVRKENGAVVLLPHRWIGQSVALLQKRNVPVLKRAFHMIW